MMNVEFDDDIIKYSSYKWYVTIKFGERYNKQCKKIGILLSLI